MDRGKGGVVEEQDGYFLGFDCSTQSLKSTATNSKGRIIHEFGIVFDVDLPQFKTVGGVSTSPDNSVWTCPTLLWVAALDLLLTQMKNANFPFHLVRCISGSGQQHGSVYWRTGAEKILETLDPKQGLFEQFSSKSAFSVPDSPIWMDSSTTAYCRNLESQLGGPDALASITGSRAYERFTIHQISKIIQTKPQLYAETERISLVSSFLCSIFLGHYAPIDWSDASGMNVMNIHTKAFDPKILSIVSQNNSAALLAKLGGESNSLVPSHKVVGSISSYFVEKYNFSKSTPIVAFSGDNPNSVAGMFMFKTGDVTFSFGTSDTVLILTEEKEVQNTSSTLARHGGHLLVSPVNPHNGYMIMLCFKNGSLTRESVLKSLYSSSSQNVFQELSSALSSTAPGNKNKCAFFYKVPEILPAGVCGYYYFDENGNEAVREKFGQPNEVVRAMIEGQMMSYVRHGRLLGMKENSKGKIMVTGGASENKEMMKVLGEVLGGDREIEGGRGRGGNAASLGACLRAIHGWVCEREGRWVDFAEAIKIDEQLEQARVLYKGSKEEGDVGSVYESLMIKSGRLEEVIVNGTNSIVEKL